jgi:hypothetical protein
MAIKVEIDAKAKTIVPLFGDTADQIVLNDISLTAVQAADLGTLIRTDKEAILTITIKQKA